MGRRLNRSEVSRPFVVVEDHFLVQIAEIGHFSLARRLRASSFDVAQDDPEPVEGSLGPRALSLFPCTIRLPCQGVNRCEPPHPEGSRPLLSDCRTRRRRAARQPRRSGSLEVDAWLRALREDVARDSLGAEVW